MTNGREPLINAVTDHKPKMLTGLNQKGRGWCRGSRASLPQTGQPPADRRGLTPRGTQAERGKPVVSPQGKAYRKGRRRDGGERRMEEAQAAL
jgi:hypothetical protein